MSVGYAQARRDFEFLEGLVELDDWVDIDSEMKPFMQNPTKAFATSLYRSAVSLWFGERRLDGGPGIPRSAYRRVSEIAERHLQEWEPSHD